MRNLGIKSASEIISELRQQTFILERENDALKASRDTYMNKVAEMQKQVNYWQRKLGGRA